jgi:hypothetical protein
MAHMLSVAAFKIRHPVMLLILMKTDDFTDHREMKIGRFKMLWRLEPMR